MRKLIAYCAISFNGKIARKDGDVAWLDSIPNPDQSDYGYYKFYETIDTTIQGYTTYDLIMNMDIDFPYSEKKNYIFTRKQGLENTEHVNFISKNHIEFVRNLKAEKGKDIWLIGGGQINTLCLNEGLIDRLHIHIMPIVISDGIELFEMIPKETHLKLVATKKYESGVMELIYDL